MMKEKYGVKELNSFFLRVGLSVVFLYAGIAAFLDPTSWVGFIPPWLRLIISPSFFLPIHATLDIIVGFWLLSGWKQFYAALAASASLLAIVVFNIGALDIIFRDIAILFSAVALMVSHWNEVK